MKVVTGKYMPASYAGKEIAFLTRHGKQRVIAPVLEGVLDCHVRHVDAFDTDKLGTFTREVPRLGTQLDAARKKAHMAIELSGLPLGLGSEGTFAPDPFIGMTAWNRELVVLIDQTRNLEVVGIAQGRGHHGHLVTSDWSTLEAFAINAGFPAQQLVVRPCNEHDLRIVKDICSWPELENALAWAVSESENGRAFIETDCRAHANPSRMQVIGQAAADLASRLASLCPECGMPGFGSIDRIAGLPCSACGAPTRETRAWVVGCLKCTCRETHETAATVLADPGRCDWCNP